MLLLLKSVEITVKVQGGHISVAVGPLLIIVAAKFADRHATGTNKTQMSLAVAKPEDLHSSTRPSTPNLDPDTEAVELLSIPSKIQARSTPQNLNVRLLLFSHNGKDSINGSSN